MLITLLLGERVCQGASVASKRDIYMVEVSVDIERPSASQAKEDGLILAREKAFSKLLGRLAVAEKAHQLEDFSSEKIPEYIKSFSVQGAKYSDVRYVATVTFDFDSQKIQSLLEENQLAFSEVGTPRLLVLPILIQDGRLVLWEEGKNLWYRAWVSLEKDQEAFEMVCPLADLEDQSSCPLREIGELKKSMLVKLKERYKVDDVLLTILSLDREPATAKQQGSWRGYIRYLPRSLKDIKAAHGLGPFSLSTELEPSLLKVRDSLLKEVRAKWQSSQVAKDQEHKVVRFKMLTDSLEEWQRFSKKIENLSCVKELKIQAFSRGEHFLWITFRGSLSEFKEVLANQGFSIDMDRDLVVLS